MANRLCNQVLIQCALFHKKPCAGFIAFTNNGGGALGSVKNFAQLPLDQAPFFLDHDQHVQPIGKVAQAIWLQRPDHAHLVKRQTKAFGRCLIHAQIVQSLQHIHI